MNYVICVTAEREWNPILPLSCFLPFSPALSLLSSILLLRLILLLSLIMSSLHQIQYQSSVVVPDLSPLTDTTSPAFPSSSSLVFTPLSFSSSPPNQPIIRHDNDRLRSLSLTRMLSSTPLSTPSEQPSLSHSPALLSSVVCSSSSVSSPSSLRVSILQSPPTTYTQNSSSDVTSTSSHPSVSALLPVSSARYHWDDDLLPSPSVSDYSSLLFKRVLYAKARTRMGRRYQAMVPAIIEDTRIMQQEEQPMDGTRLFISDDIYSENVLQLKKNLSEIQRKEEEIKLIKIKKSPNNNDQSSYNSSLPHNLPPDVEYLTALSHLRSCLCVVYHDRYEFHSVGGILGEEQEEVDYEELAHITEKQKKRSRETVEWLDDTREERMKKLTEMRSNGGLITLRHHQNTNNTERIEQGGEKKKQRK